MIRCRHFNNRSRTMCDLGQGRIVPMDCKCESYDADDLYRKPERNEQERVLDDVWDALMPTPKTTFAAIKAASADFLGPH